MEENRNFLPEKPNNLKQKLPMISEEISKHLTMLPEELRHIPVEYDFEIYIKHIEKLIENHFGHQDQTELGIGASLIVIKSLSGEGKWYETCGRVGLSTRTAQIFMKNVRDFGDNPELVEGLGYRKTERLGSLPEEYKSQLKLEGKVLLPNGNEISMTEFKRMTFRELNNEVINIKNQYNGKLRNSESKRGSAEKELIDTKKQAEEIREELEKMREDANPAMAKQIKKLEEKLAGKDAEINNLEIKLHKKEEENFEENEVFAAIDKAEEDIKELIRMHNCIKPGYHPKLGQRLISFIRWAEENLQMRYFVSDRYLEMPEREKELPENYDEDGYYEPPDL